MPPFHQQIEIGPPQGSSGGASGGTRSQRIIVRVDPAITYSVVPAAVLTMLGIEPAWTQEFQLANGGVEERPMAEIKVRLEGQERITVCVFGGPDSDPVLGKHTLDAFALTVDTSGEALAPFRPVWA